MIDALQKSLAVLAEWFVRFGSRHFELFCWVSLALGILYLTLLLFIKCSDQEFLDFFYGAVWDILSLVLLTVQGVMVAAGIYLYWLNYSVPAARSPAQMTMLPGAQWVQDKTTIYFVEGGAFKSIRADGYGERVIFEAAEDIREYYLSPDGASVLLATVENLRCLNLISGRGKLIESLALPVAQVEEPLRLDAKSAESRHGLSLRGSISGIRWSPTSRKFCYEVSRWSTTASQEMVYLYDIDLDRKEGIQSPARRVSSLYWDQKGENLYFLRHEAKDTTQHAYPFEVHVFKIPAATRVPELVTKIPFEKSSLPLESLALRQIDLFLGADQLVFGRPQGDRVWTSPRGSLLGIDDTDHLYFVKEKWFRKRLFKVPRQLPTDPRIHQGELTMDDVRWLPGGRYAVLADRQRGLFILDPESGKMGHLAGRLGAAGSRQAHAFGWHENAAAANGDLLLKNNANREK